MRARDIGSDHGKLMIALWKWLKKVMPLKQRSVWKAKQSHPSRVIDVVVPLYSDGLEDLPEIVDTLIIAGMGGINIIGILKIQEN